MPRPHTEFIQAQALPWAPLSSPGFRPGVACRTLSRDPASGASSALLRYPERWAQSGSECLACDEEFFVLQGELHLGAHRYGPGDYGFYPAAQERGALATTSGAIVLTFLEGHPRTVTPGSGKPGPNAAEAIECLRTGQQPWGGATEPAVAGPGVGRKLLKPDNALGERTWLLSMAGSESEPLEVNGVEQHPCVEEMYLLSGSFHMPSGVMRAGAYFWRPPMIKHGPMGAREPFLALFRAREGAFSTQWSAQGSPVPWNRPYQPTLPDGMPLAPLAPETCQHPW